MTQHHQTFLPELNFNLDFEGTMDSNGWTSTRMDYILGLSRRFDFDQMTVESDYWIHQCKDVFR